MHSTSDLSTSEHQNVGRVPKLFHSTFLPCQSGVCSNGASSAASTSADSTSRILPSIQGPCTPELAVVTIDKGVESKHNEQGREASTLTRSNQKHQNNTEPDAEEQGTANRQALRIQQNPQSRKGVSAPAAPAVPQLWRATACKSGTHNPDSVQEPRSVPGGS
jgi:hypothetical protein